MILLYCLSERGTTVENTMRLDGIKSKLRILKNNDAKFKVSGASKHRYESAKVEERDVQSFEAQMGIKLPDEFRSFIQYVGSGAGPGYGILSFNEIRILFKKWEDDIGKKADFTGSFQFSEDLIQSTFEMRKNQHQYQKLKLQKLDGILPICHFGGTNYVYLVICGDGEGLVWSLNIDGYETMPLGSERTYDFMDWYENWVDSNIGNFGEDPLALFYVDYLKSLVPQDTEMDVYKEERLFFEKDSYYKFSEIEEDYAIIEWLSLSNCNLNNLPDKIFKINGLKGLDLQFNNLSGIYSPTRNMKELRYLSLSHNNFKVLPETLRLLKELKVLDASHNIIEGIPDFLGELESLVYVNLSNNKIREIHPNISKLKKLKKIDLSSNKGLFGLNSLISLGSLEILNLSSCGLLVFPFYITMLQNIKQLYLTGNLFNKIPMEIKNLTSLEVLSLSESLGENLEETIELVSCFKNLKELYLPYVDLFRLPKNIIRLKNIKKITLYPSIQNRGKLPDKELIEEFLRRIKAAFVGCTIDLIH